MSMLIVAKKIGKNADISVFSANGVDFCRSSGMMGQAGQISRFETGDFAIKKKCKKNTIKKQRFSMFSRNKTGQAVP
jgi:hypothetical protein